MRITLPEVHIVSTICDIHPQLRSFAILPLRRELSGITQPRASATRLGIKKWNHYPLLAVYILWKSFRHSSQKYSSGLDSSVIIPTQAPCCQTLQMSHCTKNPAASSVTSVANIGSISLPSRKPFLESSSKGGGPGYSSYPQMQRTASSSSCTSSSPFAISTGSTFDAALSLSFPCLRVYLSVENGSSAVIESSGGSDESDPVDVDF